jgi:hypothetical protein
MAAILYDYIFLFRDISVEQFTRKEVLYKLAKVY